MAVILPWTILREGWVAGLTEEEEGGTPPLAAEGSSTSTVERVRELHTGYDR